MKPEAWIGCGFTATSENVHLEDIIAMGCIRIVCPQIAWGTGYAQIDPDNSHTKRVLNDARNVGLDVAGWAWCDAEDIEGEARHHAQTALSLGLNKFIANMESPYDAHGNSSDPSFYYCNRYMGVFRQVAPSLELGLTTTPRWASDGTGARQAGCVMMPQCFSGEVPEATIANAVPFMEQWGWPRQIQRPLVQVYTTFDQVPDPEIYNTESFTYGVGVIPYILEQAPPGSVQALAVSIQRGPPATLPIPPIEPKPDPDWGDPPTLPFCRPLYPPDGAAKGKEPSKPGSDVEALKRATSRLGFWLWQKFDQNYSNSFSHGGKSGPGIAGFQRSVSLQDTGWYGSQTHEKLRTAKIPQNLPNAGQWAFDQAAVDLYKKAKP